MLTLDNRALRDAAASAPYEFIEILVNEQQYGGGGIFNDQATAVGRHRFAEYVFVHEFGHHFAGARPTSTTRPTSPTRPAPPSMPEPWEPNVTALHDPAALKWRDLVDAGHAAADAVGQGGVREAQPREYQARAPRDPRARTRRSRRSTRSSAQQRTWDDEVPRRR